MAVSVGIAVLAVLFVLTSYLSFAGLGLTSLTNAGLRPTMETAEGVHLA